MSLKHVALVRIASFSKFIHVHIYRVIELYRYAAILNTFINKNEIKHYAFNVACKCCNKVFRLVSEIEFESFKLAI